MADIQVKDDRKKIDKILKNFDRCNFEDYVGLFESLDEVATQRGLYNEFGTKKAPARPFLEPTYMSNEKWIQQQVIKNLREFEPPRLFMRAISLKMVDKIRHKIDTMKYPKLKQSTIDKKGHDKLLKDTNLMYNSIGATRREIK